MEAGSRPRIAAYVMVGAISLVLLASGITLPQLWVKLLSALPTIITVLFYVFDRWIWRTKLVLPLVSRPWLGGTWSGTLTSYRLDQDTKQEISSRHEVILTVEQIFTNISVTLYSAESKSRSISAELKKYGSKDFTLFYLYDNTPRLELRQQSAIHRGSKAMAVHGTAPREMTAEYWTNRGSSGTFELSLTNREIVGSFKDGQALSNESRG